MSERLKCPSCSMPTIEDKWGESVTEEEMLCNNCYEVLVEHKEDE